MSKISLSFGGGGASGSDDVTATSHQLLKGYTAITTDSDDEPIEGTIESEEGKTIYASTSDQIVIPADKYTLGDIILKGLSQSGLSSDNILRGKTISIFNGLQNALSATGNGNAYKLISGSIGGITSSARYHLDGNWHYIYYNPINIGITPVFAAFVCDATCMVRTGSGSGNIVDCRRNVVGYIDSFESAPWSANSFGVLGTTYNDYAWYWVLGY